MVRSKKWCMTEGGSTIFQKTPPVKN